MIERIALVAALLCLKSQASQAAILVTVSYTYVENEVSPEHKIQSNRFTTYYRLEGRSIQITSSRGNQDKWSLGQTHNSHTATGLPYKAVIHIIGNNRFMIDQDYSSYTLKTYIETDGSQSCTVAKSVQLKPGHQYFEERIFSTHEKMLNTEVRYENIECSISDE